MCVRAAVYCQQQRKYITINNKKDVLRRLKPVMDLWTAHAEVYAEQQTLHLYWKPEFESKMERYNLIHKSITHAW